MEGYLYIHCDHQRNQTIFTKIILKNKKRYGARKDLDCEHLVSVDKPWLLIFSILEVLDQAVPEEIDG